MPALLLNETAILGPIFWVIALGKALLLAFLLIGLFGVVHALRDKGIGRGWRIVYWVLLPVLLVFGLVLLREVLESVQALLQD